MEIISFFDIVISLSIAIYCLSQVLFLNKVRKSPQDFYAERVKRQTMYIGSSLPLAQAAFKFVKRGQEKGEIVINNDAETKKAANFALNVYLIVGILIFTFTIFNLMVFPF